MRYPNRKLWPAAWLASATGADRAGMAFAAGVSEATITRWRQNVTFRSGENYARATYANAAARKMIAMEVDRRFPTPKTEKRRDSLV